MSEQLYPCTSCGTMRTKEEGGTVFTVCDACWDKRHQTSLPAPDLFADIKAFHEKFGVDYNGLPRLLPEDLIDFRIEFLREEIQEYELMREKYSEVGGVTVEEVLEEQLDALVDLVYVAIGTAYLHGFDFNEAWRRVHRANMKKVRAESASQSKRGHASDVVKPPGWVPPSHRDLVLVNAHNNAKTSQPCLFCGDEGCAHCDVTIVR